MEQDLQSPQKRIRPQDPFSPGLRESQDFIDAICRSQNNNFSSNRDGMMYDDDEDDNYAHSKVVLEEKSANIMNSSMSYDSPADSSPVGVENNRNEFEMETEACDNFRKMHDLLRRRYSTTSSVYANTSLSNPNNELAFFCISAVLQANIFEDLEFPNKESIPPTIFDVFPDIAPAVGGTLHYNESNVPMEAIRDIPLRESIFAGLVPSAEMIVRFTTYISSRAGLSGECNIIALIYINRLTNMAHFPLTKSNWRGIWLSCLIIAQKVWNDNPIRTSSFASMFPNLDKKTLRDWEVATLNGLKFSTNIKQSLYAKYYFELRQLYTDIYGRDHAFPINPLSRQNADILEYRSSLPTEKKSAKSKTSSTATPKNQLWGILDENPSKAYGTNRPVVGPRGMQADNSQASYSSDSKDDMFLSSNRGAKPSERSIKNAPMFRSEDTRYRSLEGYRHDNDPNDPLTFEDVTRSRNSRFILS